jgi:hypothetical protein
MNSTPSEENYSHDSNNLNSAKKKSLKKPTIRFANHDEPKISENSKNVQLNKNHPKTTNNRNVNWDMESLEEQERERILYPRRKILEPKTPYIPFEEGDDEYLNKLNEINKLKPTVIKIEFIIFIISL